MTTNKHGIEVLQDPSLNKSTGFTEAEKQIARHSLDSYPTQRSRLRLS